MICGYNQTINKPVQYHSLEGMGSTCVSYSICFSTVCYATYTTSPCCRRVHDVQPSSRRFKQDHVWMKTYFGVEQRCSDGVMEWRYLSPESLVRNRND